VVNDKALDMPAPEEQIHTKHATLFVFLFARRDYFLLYPSVVAIRCHPRTNKHSDDSTSGCCSTQIITSRTASTAISGVLESHVSWHRHLISWVSIVYQQKHSGPFYSTVQKRVFEEMEGLGIRNEAARSILSSLNSRFGYAGINKNLAAPLVQKSTLGRGEAL